MANEARDDNPNLGSKRLLVIKKGFEMWAPSSVPSTEPRAEPQPIQEPVLPGGEPINRTAVLSEPSQAPALLQSTKIYIVTSTFHPSDLSEPSSSEVQPQIVGVFNSLPLAVSSAETYIAYKIIPMVRSSAKQAGCVEDEIDDIYEIIANSHGPASWTINWRELEGKNVIEIWVEGGTRSGGMSWERDDMPIPIGGGFKHNDQCLCCNDEEVVRERKRRKKVTERENGTVKGGGGEGIGFGRSKWKPKWKPKEK